MAQGSIDGPGLSLLLRDSTRRYGQRYRIHRNHRDTLRILAETGTPLAYAIGVPTFGQGDENANLNETHSHLGVPGGAGHLQMRMIIIRI